MKCILFYVLFLMSWRQMLQWGYLLSNKEGVQLRPKNCLLFLNPLKLNVLYPVVYLRDEKNCIFGCPFDLLKPAIVQCNECCRQLSLQVTVCLGLCVKGCACRVRNDQTNSKPHSYSTSLHPPPLVYSHSATLVINFDGSAGNDVARSDMRRSPVGPVNYCRRISYGKYVLL